MMPTRHGGDTADTIQMECEVADQILPWSEVCEGDLALYLGILRQVETARPCWMLNMGNRVRVKFDEYQHPRYLPPHDYTAVRRYVEHPAEVEQ